MQLDMIRELAVAFEQSPFTLKQTICLQLYHKDDIQPGLTQCAKPHELQQPTFRMLVTSEPLRTKDAAMKSMSLINPHLVRSSSSFFVKVGKSTITPGRLTFLRSLQPPCIHYDPWFCMLSPAIRTQGGTETNILSANSAFACCWLSSAVLHTVWGMKSSKCKVH